MNRPTNIQVSVLRFIATHIDAHGFPPSHRDIASQFSWHSNAAPRCHLLGLEKKGFIKTATRVARGITVTAAGQELLKQGDVQELPT